MRTFLIAALLAGAAATPALAQDQNDPHARWHHNQQQNDGDGNGHREQPARGEGDARHFNGGNFSRPQEPQFVRQQPTVAQPQFEGRGNLAPQPGATDEARRGYRGGYGTPYAGGRGYVNPQAVPQQSFGGYQGRFDRQPQQPEQTRAWNGGDRRGWNGDPNVNGANRYYGRPRNVQPQVEQGRRWAGGGWNPNWRSDRRYEWQRYRYEHRNTFRVGIYYDPFGYAYQPLEIGFRMMPAYFGQQNWISDPWDYQLPPPPPGAVWVRYWNDALLVDLYSGEVVDAIHNFFW